MGVNAIDNTNLVGMCQFNCNIAGFTPAVSYVFDPAAKTVVATDGTTVPAGDTFKQVKLLVHDQFGHEVPGRITATGSGGAQTIDISALNLSRPLNITAYVSTTNGLYADGSAFHLAPAGSLSTWDKSN